MINYEIIYAFGKICFNVDRWGLVGVFITYGVESYTLNMNKKINQILIFVSKNRKELYKRDLFFNDPERLLKEISKPNFNDGIWCVLV